MRKPGTTDDAQRAHRDGGFTLPELLLTILIVGILAAIALPSFVGQSDKAHDTATKSDVRNLVSQVEACHALARDYTACETGAPGFDSGGIDGAVVESTADSFEVSGVSATGNRFTLTRDADGVVRTCTSTGSDSGGCRNGSW
ncbi:hypothetical protein DSM112329_03083 [Paraconexibacter sp. AEG42_29]|uniref:Prepilin-type N-terminal cleavage/methylation domain-containing protein n=1 Tax=Paraconexibacter sp. AEG42_29 TaxID=2997339 RepID=A0AAU7AX88_9ACTN